MDHESTPAQYMLRVDQTRHYPQDRQDVARYLVSRGCRTDILMAAALGDAELVRQHLDQRSGLHPDERVGGVVSQAGSARGRHDLHLDSGVRIAPRIRWHAISATKMSSSC